ncbi:hypothetical protein GYH30_008787 [Glycine max]|uniref:Uncharacterized protein n=2 Tax=Glycine subgen. Soja TaxID=1462606 RepID=K7KHV2_SOYBN|nr:hypothetical protein GYH30_008787 [Glycine max]RZC14793.1 hypothetical protein D0Y65_008633 [Glycine soja]
MCFPYNGNHSSPAKYINIVLANNIKCIEPCLTKLERLGNQKENGKLRFVASD